MENLNTPMGIEKETTKRELINLAQNHSEKMKDFSFFNNLENSNLSLEDYSKFFSHKYSAVGYFTDFLKRGADISSESKLPHLHKAFQKNFEDESGIINGQYDKNWEHETWRQKMLQSLKVGNVQESNPEYAQMISNIMKEKDIFFQAGYLIIVELFVAIEMQNLWKGMKRDLPKEITEYDVNNIPNNPLEYIKNHADHDGDHYSEILEATVADMKNQSEKEKCKEGIDFGYETRRVLYEYLNKVVFNKD